MERAAKAAQRPQAGRRALLDAAAALRDTSRPTEARMSVVHSPDVEATLDALPLRDLVTSSDRYPLWVDRERALFGSWYEFFPRSEGASLDPPRLRHLQGVREAAAGRSRPWASTWSTCRRSTRSARSTARARTTR